VRSRFPVEDVAVARPKRPSRPSSLDQVDLDRLAGTIRQSSPHASWPSRSIDVERTIEPIAVGSDA
jgi:hypothetical protein